MKPQILVGLVIVLVALGACTRIYLDGQESMVFQGTEYVTSRMGMAVVESELKPLGTASTTTSPALTPDLTVFAVPGVDPDDAVVMRAPDFEEEFILYTPKGQIGTPADVCPYLRRPPADCPSQP